MFTAVNPPLLRPLFRLPVCPSGVMRLSCTVHKQRAFCRVYTVPSLTGYNFNTHPPIFLIVGTFKNLLQV